MDIFYQQNSKIHSNNDIFEVYFEESVMRAGTLRRMLDRMLAFFSHMLLSLTSARAKAIFRVGGVAVSLVGMVGVIGAMESGAVSLLGGVLIGALLIGVEYLCLRRH